MVVVKGQTVQTKGVPVECLCIEGKYEPREQCRRVVEAAVDFLIDRFRPKKPNFFTKVLNYIHVKYYFTNNWI